MIIENKILDVVNPAPHFPGIIESDLYINNCVINSLQMIGGSCNGKITITNSIIYDFSAAARFFEFGLEISNCIFVNSIDLQESGYNKKDYEVNIHGNIFKCFVDFWVTYYKGPFVFKDNVLLAGSSLLGNIGTCFETIFESGSVIENNIGNLYID